MTPERQQLAIWGGGAGALVLIAVILLMVRGGSLNQAQSRVRTAHAAYEKLYHPDTAKDGRPVAEVLHELAAAKDRQDDALRRGENLLVPELPKSYQDADLVRGAAQVSADHNAVRKKAQAQNMKLPVALPFDGGLDRDESLRTRQLAYLYLYRAVLDHCITAGVTKVQTVAIGGGSADLSGAYALLTCDLDLELSYDATQRLLTALNQASAQGLGLRSIDLLHNRDGKQKLKLTVGLLTPNRPGWQLKPEKTDAGAKPAGGGRLGRLGGGT